jgi:hypothetical protein
VCDLSPCTTLEDVVVRIVPVLLTVGPHLARDTVLLTKLARLARAHLDEVCAYTKTQAEAQRERMCLCVLAPHAHKESPS